MVDARRSGTWNLDNIGCSAYLGSTTYDPKNHEEFFSCNVCVVTLHAVCVENGDGVSMYSEIVGVIGV